MRSMMYGFPAVSLDPETECTVSVDVKGVFRGEKIIMSAAFIDEIIRGHFKIKRSRLPLLNRDDVVVSYSRILKWSNGKRFKYRQGKTTVLYQKGNKQFAREYLPSSVVYIPVDPLSYISLLNVICGREPQMPVSGGVTAVFFSHNSLGNGLRLSMIEQSSISLILKNIGDIQVHVRAAILGMSI